MENLFNWNGKLPGPEEKNIGDLIEEEILEDQRQKAQEIIAGFQTVITCATCGKVIATDFLASWEEFENAVSVYPYKARCKEPGHSFFPEPYPNINLIIKFRIILAAKLFAHSN